MTQGMASVMLTRTPIELPDRRGLICGFLLRPQLPAQILEWEDLAGACENTDGTVWLHFNLVDVRAQKWITNCDWIPEIAKSMLLETKPHIQLEAVNDGFVSVLGDLHYEFDTDPDSLGLLRMYVDRKYLISVRGRPLKAIDRLRRELIQGEAIETSLDLMVHFLQYANEMFASVIVDLRALVDDMEDQILKGNFQEKRSELGTVRRSLAKLRRHLHGNRHALAHQLFHRLPSWCREADVLEFRRDVERLEAVTQDLELVQERARLLQEEIAGRLQETVNRNLYVLSIVTTTFLPVTLITGIFGMNVGGVPWIDESRGFWWVSLVLITTLGVTFSALQRQKFL
jgi:zinc transporter